MTLQHQLSMAARDQYRIFFLLAILLINPACDHTADKAMCSETQRNWTILAGEVANELDLVAEANAEGKRFDARDAISNVLYRHTGQTGCINLQEGYCEQQIPQDERDPFDSRESGFVWGIRTMSQGSGQIALDTVSGDSDAVLIYRDLSWNPICRESMPIQSMVTTRD